MNQKPHRATAGAKPIGVALLLMIPSLVAVGPLLLNGPLPLGSDVYSTSHYLQGFMKAFGEGDLQPRWTDDTNQGLGAPSFVLFPPLAYYGAGASSWLTGSIISGFKLYLFIVSLLSAAAFHALARQWIGPGLPAILAAALYLLLPYRILDMYQRFAISETTAFIFFPLILLFARRTILMKRGRDAAFLAMSYAGLICTHIVSALSFSLFLGLWILWETRGRWRQWVPPALALVCGLGLAAPVLVPAVVEKSYANINWVREMPNGDYRINFIFKDDPLPGLGFKDPVKPPVLRSAHSQLLLAVLCAILALAWSGKDQRRRRNDVIVLAAGTVLAYLMQTEISTIVWRIVPELATIQFPWRLQTIMVLLAALLAGFALSAGWGRAGGEAAARRSLLGAAPVLIVLVVATNLGLAAQNSHLKPFQFDAALSRSPGVVQWIEPAFTPIEFKEYRRFKQVRVEMPQVSWQNDPGQATISTWRSSRRVLEVDSPAGGAIVLRAFWFPGWTATIDGIPLPLRSSHPLGLIGFDIPPGRHVVELRFGATPVRRAAMAASIAALVVTAVLLFPPRHRDARARA